MRLPRLALGLAAVLGLAGALVPAQANASTITNQSAPSISGTTKFGQRLTAHAGTWSVKPTSFRYRWYRDGKPIGGATKSYHPIAPGDVGHRVSVHVLPVRAGYTGRVAWSRRTAVIAHRVPVKLKVYYRVRTRGKIVADVKLFAKLAAQTYADPRGWRGAGVEFHQVRKGGSFTLWLTQASLVPAFSSACSSQWSCRVGNNVVINQDRWQHASPAWNKAKGTLRNYRHMVIDHETGHWLGLSHRKCPGKGQLAAVMQQQSKGLGGCRFNPWPRGFELNPPRVRAAEKRSGGSSVATASAGDPSEQADSVGSVDVD